MMTGMRSCTGRNRAFASVVMIGQKFLTSPSGLRHVSHKPAKANGSLFPMKNQTGGFRLSHSFMWTFFYRRRSGEA